MLNDPEINYFIIKNLAIQPANNKMKKVKIMKENLKQAIEFASTNNANEISCVIGNILQQKIANELKDLKSEIAKNTYTFSNSENSE